MRVQKGGPEFTITALDETLNHQLPLPFSVAGISDHRFYDRHWYGLYDPSMSIAMLSGMGLYSNVGVLDGFAIMQRDKRQFNQRWSRRLYPDFTDMAVGPLRYEVIEPLKKIHLLLGKGDYPLNFDLEWSAIMPPRMEEPHQRWGAAGNVFLDYLRFHQMAVVNGWLEIEGERIEVVDWFGARDHSWGIREDDGRGAPIRAASGYRAKIGFYWWISFTAGDLTGYLAEQKDLGGERTYFDGCITSLESPDQPEVRITDVKKSFEFFPGEHNPNNHGFGKTPLYSKARITLFGADGSTWDLDLKATPNLVPWAYSGAGYSGGYRDGKGLGAYRGPFLEEFEEYDMTKDIYRSMNPDTGEEVMPGHREQAVDVTVNGKHTGHGHTMLFALSKERTQD